MNAEVDQADNRQLRVRPQFGEGIKHIDVERRRLVETADGVVEHDVRILKEPSSQNHGRRNGKKSAPSEERKKQREDDDDAGGASSGGTDYVGE